MIRLEHNTRLALACRPERKIAAILNAFSFESTAW